MRAAVCHHRLCNALPRSIMQIVTSIVMALVLMLPATAYAQPGVAATPIEPLDLRKLIADADVIVEGVIRTPTGDDAAAVVSVAHVLKGAITEKSIRFLLPAGIADNAYR